MNSKAKKGGKNTTYLNGELKSHNIWKTYFIENLIKTLVKYGKNFEFFPFETIIYRPK